MSRSVDATMASQSAENHILFSLLFFIHFEAPDLGDIETNVPIKTLFSDTFDINNFILAVSLFELHHGMNIPDELVEDDSLSIEDIVEAVKKRPRLSDDEFQRHLLAAKASFGASYQN